MNSEKEPKIWIEATRRNFQGQPNTLKNHRDTKSTNRNEHFRKKVCLEPQKWKGAKNLIKTTHRDRLMGLKNYKVMVKFKKT
jgi:hypothetical protein